MHVYIASSLLVVLIKVNVKCQNEDTLELVHVIFRHGNRTPSRSYPTDRYINETYYPYGLGQLTNKGKNKAYLLGKSLRARYNDFLGPIYTPNIIDPVSTSTNRTKMSLELVLAGLFPPKHTVLEWQKELNWQPIPYNYWPLSDHRLSIPFSHCPRYSTLLYCIEASQNGIALKMKYYNLFQYLMKYTGLKDISFSKILDIYTTLTAQKDFGLELPLWTNAVYPKPLAEAIGDLFQLTTSTAELKQLTGGFLLKKIIADTKAKIQNKLNPPDRKLFLYSAHDVSLIYMLSAMDVYFPHVPPYAAYVLLEFHQLNDIYGVKVFYQDYSKDEPRILRIPGCDYFCPFEQFVALLLKNLPGKDEACEDIHGISCTHNPRLILKPDVMYSIYKSYSYINE